MSISLILDIAVVAILLLCLIIGGSRGFIRSLLGVVILAAALLGSSILANALADPVTEWVTPRVEQYVLDRLTDGHSEEAVSAAAASDNASLSQLVDFDAITGMAKKAMDSAVEPIRRKPSSKRLPSPSRFPRMRSTPPISAPAAMIHMIARSILHSPRL